MYYITVEIEGIIANLTFTGTTKGYKGEILRGWYGPVLPEANVSGTLTLNGEKINVSGLGYHEHAWELTIPVWEWGWYWSKIVSDSFTLFWGKMMLTLLIEQQRFAVLSQGQSGYINIDPEKFEFKATEFKFYEWSIIPTKFILNVTDPDNSIYINASMEKINIHRMGVGIMYYFRYHIRVNGQITYGSTTEIITDQIQILDLMRFR